MLWQGQTYDNTDLVGDLQGIRVKPQALHASNPLARKTVDAFAKEAVSRLTAKKLLLAASAQHAATAPAVVAPHSAALVPHPAAAAPALPRAAAPVLARAAPVLAHAAIAHAVAAAPASKPKRVTVKLPAPKAATVKLPAPKARS